MPSRRELMAGDQRVVRRLKEYDFLRELIAWEPALRERLAARPWWEVVDTLTAAVVIATRLCSSRESSLAEVKALRLGLLRVLDLFSDMHARWRLDPQRATGATGVEARHFHKQELHKLQTFQTGIRTVSKPYLKRPLGLSVERRADSPGCWKD